MLSILGKFSAGDILKYFSWEIGFDISCKFLHEMSNPFFIPRHTIVAGYYGFTLDVRPSYVRLCFSLQDDNLSKHQWIFTKLGVCIDIVDIWFGIANGQISSNFYGVVCPRHAHILVSG